MRRRHRRGFHAAADVALEAIGLPRGLVRELRLAQAWRQVAGDEVAAHARAVRLRRGVLELEVDRPSCAEALGPSVVRLAARLAEACPELDVRQVRLRLGGAERPLATHRLHRP